MNAYDDLTAQMAAAGLIAAPPAEIVIEDEIDLDEALQALTDELIPGELPIEVAADDDTLSEIEGTLALEEARSEVYADQDVGSAFVEPKLIEASSDVYGPPAPKAARTPRVSGTTRSARFAGGAGSYVASVAGDADLAAIVDALPKKVKDKAANLIEHVSKGKTLSVYTQTAVNVLKAEGMLSSKRLVDAYVTQSKRNGGDGYSLGTARSQAQQAFTLFSKLGIIGSDGRLNSESAMAAKLV